ncbi:uncharacterized protein TNCV_5021291 [Trichonephila clavipes]|nr:uncharacterized protein TNCV_5021291 [Trichonephila clavipes]
MMPKSPNWWPTWSLNMIPTWLYGQDFTKFSLNRHYSDEVVKKDLEETQDANERGPDIIPQTAESEVFYMSGKLVESPGSPDIETIPMPYSKDNLVALHFKYDQARRRFVEWAQNEIAVVPDFHKRILFSDEAQFWLNGYVNKQNCRIWSEANPQVCVETPLHPEKLTVWCALWAGGILLQKR